MKPYIQRFDFILGVQATSPYNCGIISYNGTVFLNFIRGTVEPALERQFFRVLRELGVEVTVDSNNPCK